MLTIGHLVAPSMVIPPSVLDFVVPGHCSSECTALFPENGIQIFGILQHSHLSGEHSQNIDMTQMKLLNLIQDELNCC